MIDKNKIKSAAQGYCDATYGTLNTNPFIAEAFRKGAKWAINEFLNDLWHPNTEEPDKRKSDIITIGSSGESDKIGSSGYFAKIDSTGEDSVIMCAGKGSKAKAKAGSWITLSEWKWNDEKNRNVPVCVKTEYVDGNNIKADTWYQLKNGEFVEVTE